MEITTVFGDQITISDSQITTFISPLIGFDHLRQFVFFQKQDGPLSWMQSLDDPQVAFCVLAPFSAGLDPDMDIAGDDVSDIKAAGTDDIDVFTLVVLDQDRAKIRTNLRAPILVGKTSRLAKQIIVDNPQLPLQFPLKALLDENPGPC